MISRRKFFGVTAAVGAAAVVPGRRFIHDLEEREEALAGELLEARKGKTDIILRLYHQGKEVFTYPITLPSYTHDGTVHIGANESVLMDGFEGQADDVGISLAIFPEQVTMIGLGDGYYRNGVDIASGSTLTLQGNSKGLLTLT